MQDKPICGWSDTTLFPDGSKKSLQACLVTFEKFDKNRSNVNRQIKRQN